MKHSKKIVSVLLTGTLAFSSIGVAPMMAFADEITTGETVFTVTNGSVDDDPSLEAQAIRINGYTVGGYNNWRAGRPYFYYPERDANKMALDAINNYYDLVRYPRYTNGYAPYTGTITGAWYRQYALGIAYDILPVIRDDNSAIRKQIQEKIDAINNIKDPDSAEGKKKVDEYLDDIYNLANKYDKNYDWNQYYNRYLPYDWDCRWDWRNYNYDWYWGYRPSEKKSTSSSSSSTTSKTVTIFRMSNGAGDHMYVDKSTRDKLEKEGWEKEASWKALENSSNPVYVLNNKATGNHLYTANASERESLLSNGWEDGSIAFYGANSDGSKIYRLNYKGQRYLFTNSTGECKDLEKSGWTNEGVAFYLAK